MQLAFGAGVAAAYVFGHTIFADVEAGFGGWGTGTFDNRDVANGFIDRTTSGDRKRAPLVETWVST